MTPPRDQRCRGLAPAGHWRTTTFVCALSTQGLRAPLVLEGPINGAAFGAWVAQFLVPELRPSDTVVMDNLSAPKVAGVRAALRPGLQPRRAGVCQAQGDAAKNPGPNGRRPLARHWRIAGPVRQR